MLWSYCGTRAARASGILCGTKVKKDRTEFIMFFSFFVVFLFLSKMMEKSMIDWIGEVCIYVIAKFTIAERTAGGEGSSEVGEKRKICLFPLLGGKKTKRSSSLWEREREMREYNGKKCGSEKRKKFMTTVFAVIYRVIIWIASLAYYRYVICRCLSEKKKKNKKKRNISVGTLGSIVRPWPLSNC